MPKEEMYQVRWGDGTIRTMLGFSNRGVARAFVVKYGVQPGERFWVKKRGEQGWTGYSRTKTGLRSVEA